METNFKLTTTLKKQLKDFDKLYNTRNFESIFNNSRKQKPTPNLTRARNRSASSEGSTTSESTHQLDNDEFRIPRKTKKIRKLNNHNDTIATSNQFSDLEESMDTDIGNSNTTITNKHTHTPKTQGNSRKLSISKKKILPPPIYANFTNIKIARNYMKENITPDNTYTLKEYDQKLTIIKMHEIDNYNKTIGKLKASKIQFYTYAPKHLKVKSIVLKGIRGGYDETEVMAAINELQIADIKIKN